MKPHERPVFPTDSQVEPEALFREEQQFRQPWIWLPLFATVLLVVVLVGGAMWQQIVGGQKMGSNPISDETLILTGSLVIVLNVGLLALFWLAKMETEVRGGILRLRFVPFQIRWLEFPVSGLKSIEAVTYDPIREYGGWGIRYGRKGKAYNVSGNRGVQLVLDNGKRFLVGSQCAEALCTSLQNARNN